MHIIHDATQHGEWKPIFVHRNAPPLTHIFFIDDVVLFIECLVDEMEIVTQCLDRLCLAYVQKGYYCKTKFMY